MLQTRTSVCAVENMHRRPVLQGAAARGGSRRARGGAERYPLDCATGDCVYVTTARLLRAPIVAGTGILGMSTSPPKYSRVSSSVEPT